MFNPLISWAKGLDQGVLFVYLIVIFIILFFCIYIIYKRIKRIRENKLKKNPEILGIQDLNKEYKIDSIHEKYKVAYVKPYLILEHTLGEDEGGFYVNLWQIARDSQFEAKTIKVVDDPKRVGGVICIKTIGSAITLAEARARALKEAK